MEDKTLVELGETKAIAEDVKEELKETVEIVEGIEKRIEWTQADTEKLWNRFFEVESRISQLENKKEAVPCKPEMTLEAVEIPLPEVEIKQAEKPKKSFLSWLF